ncbi:MAG: LysM peptidoglycan-binding domain-containing protein [Chloroflexota bacterium]
MAEQELREAFNDCIDRMAAGQSIADCLRMYPQYAAMLRPMLEVGSLVERTQATSFEVAAAQARVRGRVKQRLNSPLPAQRSYGRLLMLAASLLIAFAAIFGAAENSLPGDALYRVKRLSENARGTILGEQFGGRRLDEIRVLLALKREADVDFTGEVEQIDGTQWRVKGLDLQVGAGTQGAASVSVGDSVGVTAHTSAQGELVALTIMLLEKGILPTASPTPSPTESPTSTPTLTPTSTDTPTLQPTQIETIAVSTAIVCVPTMPSGWVRYIIQPGDLVTVLAQQTGASVAQLIAVNCLPETQMIIVGQVLFLPMLPPATTVPTQQFQPTSTPVQHSGAQPTDDNGHDGGDDHGGGTGSGGSGDSGGSGGGTSGGPG